MAKKTYGQSPGLNSGQLLWPENLTDTFDYMQIDISKFKPSTSSVSPSSTDIPSSAVPGSLNSFFSVGFELPSIGFSSTKLMRENTILLPIPEDLSFKDNPQWSDQAVGVMGKFGPEIFKGFQDGDTDAITSNVQKLAQAGSIGTLLKMIKKTGADPNAITQNINGKIANPYMEQVFGGVGLRQFDFNWKLVPRNVKEQASIHSIIRKLRESVLPNKNDAAGDAVSEGTQVGTDRWLTVPKVFDITWRTRGSEIITSLPKLKSCVCKDIQVQYTPDNVWATHMAGNNNPYPVAYNLTLSFGEMEIITSDLVKKGY